MIPDINIQIDKLLCLNNIRLKINNNFTIILINRKRRRRGTLLKAAGGGAALGLGAVMLHKAFKKKN